jgi:hypothetical protein
MRSVLTRLIGVGLVVAALVMLVPAVCGAQEAAPPAPGDAAELAKKLSNPISNLVSVPFQLNWEQGVGPNDQTRFVLNVQPVMPFTLNRLSASRRWRRVGRRRLV